MRCHLKQYSRPSSFMNESFCRKRIWWLCNRRVNIKDISYIVCKNNSTINWYFALLCEIDIIIFSSLWRLFKDNRYIGHFRKNRKESQTNLKWVSHYVLLVMITFFRLSQYKYILLLCKSRVMELNTFRKLWNNC